MPPPSVPLRGPLVEARFLERPNRFLTRVALGRRKMYLEVKSITLVEGGIALFPDAVTARGTRHVHELAHLAQQRGTTAAILFIAQRSDVCGVCAARSIDPLFAEALAKARKTGVLVLARRCEVGLEEVRMGEALPVIEEEGYRGRSRS